MVIAGTLLAVLALGWPALRVAPAAAAPVALSGLAPALAGGGSSPTAAQIRAAKQQVKGISLTPSPNEPHWACPESLCEALIAPRAQSVVVGGHRRFRSATSGRLLEGSGVEGGFDPQDLQSAYDIPISAGEPQTVAVVDAYGYSTAEQDLAVYRQKYGLPPCTKANGCFHKINQHGEEANYPPDEPGWDGEAALDIEMVSAACPSCHIIQAEGDEPRYRALGEAVDSAARAGANEISASYGSPESYCEPECEAVGAAYDVPGVMVFVSGGDDAYDDSRRGGDSPNFPAALPWVVAVGGTNLFKASNARGWEDTVWVNGGSGCSSSIPKPAWQADPACPDRMSVDVAADASCETPLSTYDHAEGWELVCGTSASSPLLAGIEAHANAQTLSLPGADAFYGDPGALFDVTKGSNGDCSPPTRDSYFCTAGPGYDGPTGNGVPDGALGVTQPPPSVRTSGATAVTGTGAVLNGVFDPQGLPTTYQFEYGTSTAYGGTTPAGEPLSGSASLNATAAVEDLEPGRVYHFRLVANSVAGTSYGADQTFVTEVPSVTSITPTGGPADGGTTVTISGSGFEAAASVHFGTREAVNFTVDSNETITAEAPFGAGSAEVTVTTPAGTSATEPAATFTWAKAGSVFAWGSDSGGQLGNGSRQRAVDDPVEVRGLREAVQLAGAATESLALMGDGTVMGWGKWGSAIGAGGSFSDESDVPVEVCAVATKGECPHGPYLHEAVSIAAGRYFSLALLKNGRVVSWGSDAQGQLGRPQEHFSEVNGQDYTPGYVCTRTSGSPGECKGGHYLQEVVAIAAGEDFSLALLKDGTVMAWGADEEGQLASEKRIKTKCRLGSGKEAPCSRVPVPVAGLSEITEISAGDHHSLALQRDGTVKAWGSNSLGELGAGTAGTNEARPISVCAPARKDPCGQLEDVLGISAGYDMSTAVLADGSVVDWGLNANGSLGDGSFEGPETCTVEEEGEVEQLPCSSAPVPVPGLAHVREAKTGLDDYDVLALTAAGELWSWGSDTLGGVGIGEPISRDVPTRVCAPLTDGPCPEGPYLEGEVNSFAVGGFHDLLSLRIAQAIVESVSPDEGPGAGGTTVTITGTGFTPATGVDFGTKPASSFEVRSDTEIVAVAPPGSGTVDVTVSTPDGPSEVRLADRFTYDGSTLTSLDPDVGPGAGGTPVTITGTKLSGASAVDFGATPAESFEVRSAGEIVAVSPPGTGTVQVTVTTPEGVTPDGEASRFYYESAPTVTTREASQLTRQTAHLSGEVNPNLGKITACRFEWGLSEAYEHSVSCKGPGASAEGNAEAFVYRELTGLKTATTYHYRVVAENAFGAGYGMDRTFTTLAAELPELGRCELLSSAVGTYDSQTCTTETPGQGDYEWDQGPGPAPGFTASARKVSFTQSGGGITCAEAHGSGEYTGAWSATMSLQLKGCEASGTISGAGVSGKCQSEAAEPGEIDSEPLSGLLAWTKRTKAKVGWGFNSLSETRIDVLWTPVASFTCGVTAVAIVGGIDGELKGLGAPVTSSALHLGHQLEAGGGPPYLFTGTEPQSAKLKGTFTLTGEEPIEVKTTR